MLDVTGSPGAMDLTAGMRALAQAGLTTVLVEGGGGLAAALVREDLVDEIHWILAPALLGREGRPALGSLGIRALAQAPKLEWVGMGRLGDDIRITARRRVGHGDNKQ